MQECKNAHHLTTRNDNDLPENCHFIQSHLLEVFIEKSVKYGVGADRGDANDVEEHEESHHVLRCVKHVRCLSHQAEQAGMEEVKVEAG